MAEVFPIVIIGAGASGMMAAIAASRTRPHAVLLLEKEERVGRKLLATGNGRCNLLNMRVNEGAYHGSGAEAALALLREKLPPASLLEAFGALGLACREEAQGRVYPLSNQASSVLDVLRMALDRLGVRVRTQTAVKAVFPAARGFELRLASGESIRSARVIVAGGGQASPSLGSDGSALSLLASLGHPIIAPLPAIVPLKLAGEHIRGLKGVRAQAALTLLADGGPVREEEGEALFTDYGLSGIAAMQLARHVPQALAAGKKVEVRIALLEAERMRREVAMRAALYEGKPLERIGTGLMHSRIALCLLRQAGLAPQAPIDKDAAQAFARLASDWRIPVTGTQSFAAAQVTAGGAQLSAFDPATLASTLCPGLYACGEALDVDGDCGGYNLMWAWASGLVAGGAAAESLE